MSDSIIPGQPIGNLLYTRESKASRERTAAELEIEDPQVERALGILNNADKQGDGETKQLEEVAATDE